jgi:hypothetical protein
MEKILRFDPSQKFPATFPAVARDLVTALLTADPTKRLGVTASAASAAASSSAAGVVVPNYAALKAHPFFGGVVWNDLPSQTAPVMATGGVAPQPDKK